MEIKQAAIDDIDDVVDLGREMHDESPRFRKFPYAPAKLYDLARALILSPDGIIVVARDDGGALRGMLVGMVAEHFFSSARYATDLLVYVTPEHRGGSTVVRLLRLFERWARQRGASELAPGLSTDVAPARTQQLYERLGFRPVGAIMVKDL